MRIGGCFVVGLILLTSLFANADWYPVIDLHTTLSGGYDVAFKGHESLFITYVSHSGSCVTIGSLSRFGFSVDTTLFGDRPHIAVYRSAVRVLPTGRIWVFGIGDLQDFAAYSDGRGFINADVPAPLGFIVSKIYGHGNRIWQFLSGGFNTPVTVDTESVLAFAYFEDTGWVIDYIPTSTACFTTNTLAAKFFTDSVTVWFTCNEILDYVMSNTYHISTGTFSGESIRRYRIPPPSSLAWGFSAFDGRCIYMVVYDPQYILVYSTSSSTSYDIDTLDEFTPAPSLRMRAFVFADESLGIWAFWEHRHTASPSESVWIYIARKTASGWDKVDSIKTLPSVYNLKPVFWGNSLVGLVWNVEGHGSYAAIKRGAGIVESEFKKVDNITVHPNPALNGDIIEISGLNVVDAKPKISVTDICGRSVGFDIIGRSNREVFLKINSQRNGVYFINIKIGLKNIVKKVVFLSK